MYLFRVKSYNPNFPNFFLFMWLNSFLILCLFCTDYNWHHIFCVLCSFIYVCLVIVLLCFSSNFHLSLIVFDDKIVPVINTLQFSSRINCCLSHPNGWLYEWITEHLSTGLAGLIMLHWVVYCMLQRKEQRRGSSVNQSIRKAFDNLLIRSNIPFG